MGIFRRRCWLGAVALTSAPKVDLLRSPTTALQGSQQSWLHPGITWEA